MRIKRLAAAASAVITAVFGLSVITASPAAAAVGSWRAYGETNPIRSSTSTWKCAATSEINDDVFAQACAIRSANGLDVQVAVLVHNIRAIGTYNAEAAMTEVDATTGRQGIRWECPRSGVGADSYSVCFGTSYPDVAKAGLRVGEAGVNGQTLATAGAKV